MEANVGFHLSYTEDGDSWRFVERELAKKLPIRVSWHNKEGIVSEVSVEASFKYITDEVSTKLLNNGPAAWTPLANFHLEPYCRIFVLTTEDYEAYKSTLKARIQKWLPVEKEWLIVHVSHKPQSLFERSIYTSIKNDFNTIGSTAKTCQLKIQDWDKASQEESLVELVTKIKDCVAKSGARITDDFCKRIRKLDSERVNKGWNFLPFYATKEGLAFAYESAHQLQEALMQYDELETLFGIQMSNRSLEFKNFGAEDGADDSATILDWTRKNFRDRICDNSITELDFRQYLFARQAHLLFLLNKPLTVAERGRAFVDNMMQIFARQTTPLTFRRAWCFSACVDIAEACKLHKASVSGRPLTDRAEKHTLSVILGSLYYTAVQMMLEIGVQYDLLPPPSDFIFGPEPHMSEFAATEALSEHFEAGSLTAGTSGSTSRASLSRRESSNNLSDFVSTSNSSGATTPTRSSSSSLPTVAETPSSTASTPSTPSKGKEIGATGFYEIDLNDGSFGPPAKPTHKRNRSITSDGSAQLLTAAADALSSSGEKTPSGSPAKRATIHASKLNSSRPSGSSTPTAEKLEERLSRSLLEASSAPTPAIDPTGRRHSLGGDTSSTTLFVPPDEADSPGRTGPLADPPANNRSTTPTRSVIKPIITTTAASTSASSSTILHQISHPSLSAAAESLTSFDKLFITISNKATQSLREARRIRAIVRLIFDVGLLHLYTTPPRISSRSTPDSVRSVRGRYSEAVDQFRLACKQYSNDVWPKLLYRSFNYYAECTRQLGTTSDYAFALLELLSPKVKEFQPPKQAQYCLDELVAISTNIEVGVSSGIEPLFEVEIVYSQLSRLYTVDQPIGITAKIVSKLPKEIVLTRLVLKLRRQDSKSAASQKPKDILISLKTVTLVPGLNSVQIDAMGAIGKFKTEFVAFDIGQVTLLQDLTIRGFPSVNIKPSPATADFEVSQPDWLVVDNWQLLQVDLHTNQDRFRSSTVEIKPSQPNSLLRFKPDYQTTATITNRLTNESTEEPITIDNGIVNLPKCPKNHTIQFFVPIMCPSVGPSLADPSPSGTGRPPSRPTTPEITELSAPSTPARVNPDWPMKPEMPSQNNSVDMFSPPASPTHSHANLTRSVIEALKSKATHELTLELRYRKFKSEKKLIRKIFDLTFLPPISINHRIIPIEGHRFYLSVAIKCEATVPLELQQYWLDLASNLVLFNDPNANAAVIGTAFGPNEEMSLLFALDLQPSANGSPTKAAGPEAPQDSADSPPSPRNKQPDHLFTTTLNLRLQFKHPEADDAANLKLIERQQKEGISMLFQHQIVFNAPQVHFEVQVSHSPMLSPEWKTNAQSATEIPIRRFDFSITNLRPDVTVPSRHRWAYTVEYNPNCWLLLGRKRGTLPKEWKAEAFQVKLAPLRAGYLPLPFLRFCQMDISKNSSVKSEDERVKHFYTPQSCVVAPASRTLALCPEQTNA